MKNSSIEKVRFEIVIGIDMHIGILINNSAELIAKPTAIPGTINIIARKIAMTS